MGDVTCRQCSEPWNLYHVNHEFTDDEKDDFLNGQGCPSCDWGDNEERVNNDKDSGTKTVEQVESMLNSGFDGDPVEYI